MSRRSEERPRARVTRRPAEYIEQWKASPQNRSCRACGESRLRKKDLMALLDAAPRKDTRALRKLVRLTAAQLAGYCSIKCRHSGDA